MKALNDYIATLEQDKSGDGFAEAGIAFARKLIDMINADPMSKESAEKGWQESAFRFVAAKIDWKAEGEDKRFWLDLVRGL